MKEQDKKFWIIAGVIAIILIIAIVVMAGGKEKAPDNQGEPQNNNSVTQQNNVAGPAENTLVENYVKVQNDGTKVNQSEELKKMKTVDGLEISNIQLTEKGNLSVLIADVKNNTDTVRGDFGVKITLIDKDGKDMITLDGYIDKVEAGETVKMETSATTQLTNAYDFKIVKK